ncbi:MAG: HupE/UreJ family protein [Pseudorhodoplanes sp.]
MDVMVCMVMVAVSVVVWCSDARAHALQPGFLELSAQPNEAWRVTWRVPDVNGRPMPIQVQLPENCSPRDSGKPVFDGTAWVFVWRAVCPGGIADRTVAVEGLEQTVTDVLVRFELASGQTGTVRLTGNAPSAKLPGILTLTAILSTYVSFGVEHILLGIDHLLFVFALLLLVPDTQRLIGAITAFTLAHSLSLVAATLGWIVVPAPPVEAVIALSIMFLASELARPLDAQLSLTERHPWAISFAFGLLHGLGFARALIDIGLPKGDVPLALFSFNLGVEIGQLIFVAFVLLTGLLLAWLYPRLIGSIRTRGTRGLRVLAYAMGSVASIWFVSRVAAF